MIRIPAINGSAIDILFSACSSEVLETLMDKACATGAGDSSLESLAGPVMPDGHAIGRCVDALNSMYAPDLSGAWDTT